MIWRWTTAIASVPVFIMIETRATGNKLSIYTGDAGAEGLGI